MPAPTHSRILILDFGSQVTQLIARRLRETHVYCEIHPWDVGDELVRTFAPKGIILSGSHESVHDAGAGRAPDRYSGPRRMPPAEAKAAIRAEALRLGFDAVGFTEAHRDACADRSGRTDKEGRPGVLRGEGRGEDRRQGRYRAVH